MRALALCAVAIAAYVNSFGAGFTLDSRQLILQDPRVRAATAENVSLILHHSYWWPYGESGLYRPVTTLSYLFNYAVLGGGATPFSYHAFNLLLHLLNVLLVWRLVQCVTRREDVAFAAAAIWAVLPVSVEAVTNIVGRADLLAAFGVLGGLLCYAEFRRPAGAARALAWIGVAAATIVAAFSKESGIVVAPLIVCAEIALWDRTASPRRLGAIAVPIALPLIAMWAVRWAVLGAAPQAEFAFTDNPIVGAGWPAARLTALKTTGLYLWKLAWPMTLSADYSFNAIPLAVGSVQDVLAWLTVAACAAAMVVAGLRSRSAAFLSAFAIVAFLPASNLLFATGTIFGERLLYLPAVGIVALAALALSRLPRGLFVGVAAVMVLACAARTWRRNPDWRSDVTLWRAAAAAEPSSAKAHRALAEAMYDADPTHANIDAVLAEAERSVALVEALPDAENSPQAYRQAAAYHLDRAHLVERTASAGSADATRAYERAVALTQRCLAIIRAQSAARTDASSEPAADAYRLLAAARLGLRQPQEALDAAAGARRLNPLSALAYRLSASARLLAGKPDEAIVDLMVGSIVSGDTGLNDAVIGVYRSGVDEGGCATVTEGGRAVLNLACPIVRQHTCDAVAAAIPIEQALGRRDAADRLRSTARTTLGCRP